MPWTEVGNSHRIRASPSSVPRPLQYQGPIELNIDEVTPSNFEKLVVAVIERTQNVEVAQLYGLPGQRQNGIDVIARLTNGGYRSYQAKRYQKFSVAALRKAVRVWEQGGRPFSSDKFVLVVACPARGTEVLNELERMREDKGLNLELWDRLTLSNLLRDLPSVVAQFFGPTTAAAFCPTFGIEEGAAPPATDHRLLADAAVRGPLRALDLSKSSAAAEDFVAAQQFPEATALFETVAHELEVAGFAFHSEFMLRRAAETAASAGDHLHSVGIALDLFWKHVAQLTGISNVEPLVNQLRRRRDSLPENVRSELDLALTVVELQRRTAGIATAARAALLQIRVQTDLLLPIVVLIEHALAADVAFRLPADLEASLSSLFADHSVREEAPEHAFRLGACLSEMSGSWDDFLALVRSELRPEYHAWGNARRASAEALSGSPATAEQHLLDAVEKACAAGAESDAADWLYALRLTRIWNGHVRLGGHDEHTMAQQLKQSRAPSRLPGSPDVVLRANQGVKRSSPSAALPLVQAWRTQAYVRGDLSDRLQATQALGQLFADHGEHAAAIDEFVFCGHDKGVKASARELPEVPLAFAFKRDAWRTTSQIDSAMRAAVAVSDLVPDEQARGWLDVALPLLRSDYSHLAPSMGASHLDANTFAVVRAFAPQLTDEEALEVLALIAPWLEREDGHHRWTDDDHIKLLSVLATRSSEVIVAEAVRQIVAALGTTHEMLAAILRSDACVLALQQAKRESPDLLNGLDRSSRDGALAICTISPTEIDATVRQTVDEHAGRVSARKPATATYSAHYGGDAEWSTLVRALSSEVASHLADTLLACASNTFEPMGNRNSALAALGDVSSALPEADRRELFGSVQRLLGADVEDQSIAGIMARSGPFSAFRFNDPTRDLQGGAFYALVQLAIDPPQYADVQRLALRSMSRADEKVAVQIAQALTRVPVEHRAIGIEALQHFSIESGRSLLAVLWAEERADPEIGRELANDTSPIVRRSLARALAESGTESEARELLAVDCRRSVRLRAHGVFP